MNGDRLANQNHWMRKGDASISRLKLETTYIPPKGYVPISQYGITTPETYMESNNCLLIFNNTM
jgi:hypothetical protein